MAELNADLRARIEAAAAADDLDLEDVSLEEIIEQFDRFDGRLDEVQPLASPSGLITVALIRSESGDDILEAFPGALTPQEVALEAFLGSPDWWGEPDNMSISEIKIYSITG